MGVFQSIYRETLGPSSAGRLRFEGRPSRSVGRGRAFSPSACDAATPGLHRSLPLAAILLGTSLIFLAAILSTANPAAAETRETLPAPVPSGAPKALVSTSPDVHSSAIAVADRPRPMQVIEDEPPLTRAAARQRIETMSPTRWLERFGPVTVDRRP
jgi:hypothetical protein